MGLDFCIRQGINKNKKFIQHCHVDMVRYASSDSKIQVRVNLGIKLIRMNSGMKLIKMNFSMKLTFHIWLHILQCIHMDMARHTCVFQN